MELTNLQLEFTSADIENYYFVGEKSPPDSIYIVDVGSVLPPGNYRVIDGNLFRFFGAYCGDCHQLDAKYNGKATVGKFK